MAESWLHAEITAVPADERDELAATVGSVLADVHHAVDDAPGMYALIRELADTLRDHPGQFDRETSTEAGSLLRWLADGNFMILGHVSYSANELATAATSGMRPPADPQAGGVLRGGAHISVVELLPAFRSGAPVVIFKSALMSTVLRADRFDCVTVVAPAHDGEPPRVHVFLGLFTETGDVIGRVPVLRRRIKDVLAQAGVRANSYTGRQLIAALRTLPRDELLEADVADLVKLATLVSNRAQQGGIGVFSRLHLNRDFISVLVYLPAERLGPETTRRVRVVVGESWPGALISRDVSISTLGLARLHFLITLRPGEPGAGAGLPRRRGPHHRGHPQLERRPGRPIADGRRRSRQRRAVPPLRAIVPGGVQGGLLGRDRGPRHPPARAAAGRRRAGLRPVHPARRRRGPTPAEDSAHGSHISLARVLPMLSHMGMEVLDERPYELERRDGSPAWIYDFGLGLPAGVQLEPGSAHAADVLESLRRLWRGDAEQDGFNALVLGAGLNWRQVTVLRAYAKYLRQTGTPFSQGYIEQTLSEHPVIAQQLVELFEARFDPTRQPTAPAASDGEDAGSDATPLSDDDPIVASVLDALGEVSSLDQDRILRALLGLITATLRTNVFRDDARIGDRPGDQRVGGRAGRRRRDRAVDPARGRVQARSAPG